MAYGSVVTAAGSNSLPAATKIYEDTLAGGEVVQGVKLVDGTAGGSTPLIVGANGAQVEVKASVLPTGAATETGNLAALVAIIGATATAAWDGVTGSTTALPVLRAIWLKLAQMYTAMTDATAKSLALQDGDVNGKQLVWYASYPTAAAADTIIASFTQYLDGVATGSGALTSYTVPAGYKFVLNAITIASITGGSNSVAANGRFFLRHQTQAAATIGSPKIWEGQINNSATANSFATPSTFNFGRGQVFLAGDSFCVSTRQNTWAGTTNDPTHEVFILGMLVPTT